MKNYSKNNQTINELASKVYLLETRLSVLEAIMDTQTCFISALIEMLRQHPITTIDIEELNTIAHSLMKQIISSRCLLNSNMAGTS